MLWCGLRCILLSVVLTLVLVVPSPGVRYMHSVVRVRPTWYLGQLTILVDPNVVRVTSSVRGLVPFMLLSVRTTTCWVTNPGLLFVLTTCVS